MKLVMTLLYHRWVLQGVQVESWYAEIVWHSDFWFLIVGCELWLSHYVRYGISIFWAAPC